MVQFSRKSSSVDKLPQTRRLLTFVLSSVVATTLSLTLIHNDHLCASFCCQAFDYQLLHCACSNHQHSGGNIWGFRKLHEGQFHSMWAYRNRTNCSVCFGPDPFSNSDGLLKQPTNVSPKANNSWGHSLLTPIWPSSLHVMCTLPVLNDRIRSHKIGVCKIFDSSTPWL